MAGLPALLKETKRLPWLYVYRLRAGDTLMIRTVNRQEGKDPQRVVYRIKILNSAQGSAQLTIYRKGRKTERVSGKILGSAVMEKKLIIMKKSGIAVGFPIVFRTDDFGDIKLFPTQEVWRNGRKILPNLSKLRNKREK